jgi:hypothetical protein
MAQGERPANARTWPILRQTAARRLGYSAVCRVCQRSALRSGENAAALPMLSRTGPRYLTSRVAARWAIPSSRLAAVLRLDRKTTG